MTGRDVFVLVVVACASFLAAFLPVYLVLRGVARVIDDEWSDLDDARCWER